jgi:hypothetical protein
MSLAEKYIVTSQELSNIADAIREKNGNSGTILFNDMPQQIRDITTSGGGSGETLLKPADYVDYVRAEAMEVAKKVRSVMQSDSIISLCMSDSHYGTQGTYLQTNTNISGKHALEAIKALSYFIPIDFIAHLGDVGWEGVSSSSSVDTFKTNANELLGYLKEAAGDSIPLFVAIGNHDAADYIPDENKIEHASYLYNNFTKLSGSDAVYSDNTSEGGYCYRDIVSKKLRVFLVNTCGHTLVEGSSGCVSATQSEWIASNIDSLNEKTDASEWSFIILSHYPLDFSTTKTNLCNKLYTYVTGEYVTGKYTEIESNKNYTFKNKRKARFIGQFHGHIHNFLYDKLHYGWVPDRINGTVSTNQFNAYRLCIPNAEFNRENTYCATHTPTDSSAPSDDGYLWGIKFFEGVFHDGEKYDEGVSAQHKKESNSSNDTSFVVNVINPREEKIYSFCYGAGVDREIGYNFNKQEFNIVASLENATMSNPATLLYKGDTYTTQISANKGYKLELNNITVKMSGVDISSSAVEITDGVATIAIPSVTGNIEILVSNLDVAYYAVEYTLTNVVQGTAPNQVDNTTDASYSQDFTNNGEYLINPYLSKVTMNGEDITNTEECSITELDNGCRVYIPNVNGPLKITLEAQKSNLWKVAKETDKITPFNNGLGYKKGLKIHSGGNESETSGTVGYIATGYIEYEHGEETILDGCLVNRYPVNENRIYFYDKDYQFIADGGNGPISLYSGTTINQNTGKEQTAEEQYHFNSRIENDKLIITPNPDNLTGRSNAKFIRLNVITNYEGKDMIINVQ